MKTSAIVPLVALALAALGIDVPRAVEAGETPLRVVTVAGRAEVQLPGSAAWDAAKLRLDLGPGAAARTARGRLALATPSGQEVRLAGLSQVSLPEGVPDLPTRVKLDAGTIWAAVLPDTPPNRQIEVQTPAVSVLVGVGGTEVTAGRDGSTLVRVFHGMAVCSRPGTEPQWSRALSTGQELVVPTSGQPGPARKIDREKINMDWAKWNEEQDDAGGYRPPPPPK